ncbi:hypothetical protein A464_4185 [Salmonella bongori N268-08]|uniref:Uncharacterized protein n=1 Tax=Salmonella bongori N268-08 TaxID=1197719 RepID=S5N2W5_SALBN|nr:hypothetical protein A464_4185 [Salmonella bongori N268-08]
MPFFAAHSRVFQHNLLEGRVKMTQRADYASHFYSLFAAINKSGRRLTGNEYLARKMQERG